MECNNDDSFVSQWLHCSYLLWNVIFISINRFRVQFIILCFMCLCFALTTQIVQLRLLFANSVLWCTAHSHHSWLYRIVYDSIFFIISHRKVLRPSLGASESYTSKTVHWWNWWIYGSQNNNRMCKFVRFNRRFLIFYECLLLYRFNPEAKQLIGSILGICGTNKSIQNWIDNKSMIQTANFDYIENGPSKRLRFKIGYG